MNRKKRTIVIALLLLFVGSCGVSVHSQYRQSVRNRQLIAALVKKDTKKALTLLIEGADPNTQYKPTSLAEHVKQLLYCSSIHNNPTAFLIVCGAEPHLDFSSVVIQSNYLDDTTLLRAMLTHGANVNAKNNDGWTALMYAALANHQNTVETLLQNGADANANIDGLTPLKCAQVYPDIIAVLRKYGAK